MKKTVLIVDDFKKVLTILRTICESLGLKIAITTVLCKSANEAIRAIMENKPDILFLDYQFNNDYKDRNGADVARWIDEKWNHSISVASHTLREEKEAREIFYGTKCVTHFVEHDEKRIREFLEYSLSL
jgi:CheY-like chemotaxis protein